MATTTTKLGLTKPDFVDVVDISQLNTNANKIDLAVGFTICTSATRPATPWAGQPIFETDTLTPFIWSGSAWVVAGGGGSIEISATAPATPSAGDLWWDSDNGALYIYYNDGTSSQWVDAASPRVFISATAPTGYPGQLWLDSDDGSMYVYYTDPGGVNSQWIGAVSRSGGILQVVSTTKTDTFSATSSAFTDVTGLSATITPRSTSSKIYVAVSANISGNDNAVRIFLRTMRDSTAINVGDAAGSRVRATWQGYVTTSAGTNKYGTESVNGTILDSPSTTSSVTYKVQVSATSGAVYINRNGEDTDATTQARTPSTITLIEVAG